MRRILVLGLVSLLVGTGATNEAHAQTTVSSPIAEDTTWSSEGSPYVLSGPIEVDRPATLTVEEGATIRGTAGSALVVEGTLLVQGTASNPVSFTNDVEDETWDGIKFLPREAEPIPDESSILGARISGATIGIEVRDRQAAITESYLERNASAILLMNPFQEIGITSNVFVENATAINGRTRSTVRIEDNDFWNNEVNLFMQPQDIYDCGPDEGTWEVHRNDILLGPVNDRQYSYNDPGQDYAYRPLDVRTPTGSGSSPYVISATDNWWGTTVQSEIEPRITDETCCPSSPGKRIVWEPFSQEPNTAWEPEGPVLKAYSDSFHGDPSYVAYVRDPEHGRCFTPGTARRITGSVSGALGGPVPPKFALRRMVDDRCSWWSARRHEFVRDPCNEKKSWLPPYEKSDNTYISTVRFRPPLPRGRYTAFITGKGDGFYTTPGRSEIAFRVLGSG